MITEYHRPQTLEEALALLARTEILTVPLGGGTFLNSPAYPAAHIPSDDFAVVDLQALGLNTFERGGTNIEIGAAVTLQVILDTPGLPEAIYRSVRNETTFNLRQVATIAGTLVAADGRSPFATVMLALEAHLTILPDEEVISLGDLLPLRFERLHHRLITRIGIPAAIRLAYAYVARTPADHPLVCAAVARWPSGRTRLALGGHGPAPVLAMDGPESGEVEAAARAAYSQAGDEWASAAYRSDVAGVLAMRCLERLAKTGEVKPW
jgi:putative selenate reductase FAD-binding subunit